MSIDIKAVWKKADSLRGCLSHLKQKSGRRRYSTDEDPLSIENTFVGDEAKLLSSKTWRTMGDKTQVFTLPKTPLIRTRQSHVAEVIAISVITSEHLGLNTNLVRAAAVGHDIGHVPFGHQGEAWMAQAMGRPEFCHEVMGPIIAQKIERKGQGLNLTFETLQAMMCHSGSKAREGMSQEAWVLRYTDKFAYIFHDLNDIVMRMKYPVSRELIDLADLFGTTQRERTTTAIAALVVESAENGAVSFSRTEPGEKFNRLRNLMYEVYPCVTQQDVEATLGPVLEFLKLLHIADPFLLLALMTDKDVVRLAAEPMKDMDVFNRTSLVEIVPYLSQIGTVDLCDPNLNW